MKPRVTRLTNVRTEEGPRLQVSAWHITVNTNLTQKRRAAGVDVAQSLDDATMEWANSIQQYFRTVGRNRDDSLEDKSKFPEDPDIQFAVEHSAAARGSRVHVHIFVMLRHYSRVQLDYIASHEFFNSKFAPLGSRRVYWHAKLIATQDHVLEYIKKGTQAETARSIDPIGTMRKIIVKAEGGQSQKPKSQNTAG